MSALGLYRERTAEGIQAEHGVGARDQRYRVDRGFRNEVPVDGIAEGFIDADAIDVDGKPLRRAEQRRGGEAVVVDVDLEGIARALAGVDAAEVVVEVVGRIRWSARAGCRALLAVCTFEGIWFSGRPKPGSGVLPITMTCGSSCTAAGLARAPASRSASAAGAGAERARPAMPARAPSVQNPAQRPMGNALPVHVGGGPADPTRFLSCRPTAMHRLPGPVLPRHGREFFPTSLGICS